MKPLIFALLFSSQLFAQVSQDKTKPVLTPMEKACNDLQGLLIDTMETCKNQKSYKKFVEDIEELECKKFAHSFFVVLRPLLENNPYRHDSTCFDKETFDSALSESLVNEFEIKFTDGFAILASASKLSREAFLKLPLNMFSEKVLSRVGKRFPADTEDRKKVMTIAFQKLQAAHHTKKPGPAAEKNFAFYEGETGLKRTEWKAIGHYGVTGCRAIEKVVITAPTESVEKIQSDEIAKTLIDLLKLQPTSGDPEPPYVQPTAAIKKQLQDALASEKMSAWIASENLEADKKKFLASIEAKNIRWILLRSFAEKSLQKYEYQFDLSTVSRCSLM